MSQTLAEPIARLIEEFGKLPGVGPKTAQRLTFHLLRQPAEEAHALAQAIADVKEQIILCRACFNLSATDPCQFCADPGATAPRSASWRSPWTSWRSTAPAPTAGLYHVLHGSFSPMEGVLEDDLQDPRAGRARPRRRAVGGSHPGHQRHRGGRSHGQPRPAPPAPLAVRVTRLAQGLPIGSDLEYADDYTLTRAIEGRRDY